jgi:hypothetical protein
MKLGGMQPFHWVFVTSWEVWKACHSVCCGTCYGTTKANNYLMKELMNEDGEDVLPRLKDNHNCARTRNFDDLLCPFQWNICHFHNIKKWDLRWVDFLDKNMLLLVRRPLTISGNLAMMIQIFWVHVNIHWMAPWAMLRHQGPHLVKDTFWMMMVMAFKDHSLNTGINFLPQPWTCMCLYYSDISYGMHSHSHSSCCFVLPTHAS